MRVHVARAGPAVPIGVRDSGPGMDETQLAHVFDRLSRGFPHAAWWPPRQRLGALRAILSPAWFDREGLSEWFPRERGR